MAPNHGVRTDDAKSARQAVRSGFLRLIAPKLQPQFGDVTAAGASPRGAGITASSYMARYCSACDFGMRFNSGRMVSLPTILPLRM